MFTTKRWVSSATATAVVLGGFLLISQTGSSGTDAAPSLSAAGPDADSGPVAYGVIGSQTAQSTSAAISATMAGMSGSQVAGVNVLDSAPSGLAAAAPVPWLQVQTDRTPDQLAPDSIETMWQSDIVAGAIADRVSNGNSDLHDAFGGVATQAMGDSAAAPIAESVGDIASGQQFPAQLSKQTDNQILNTAASAVSALGYRVTAAQVFRPLGPALDVRLVAPNAKISHALVETLESALVRTVDGSQIFEGYYIEIDAPDGTPMARSAASSRDGSGRTWLSPQFSSEDTSRLAPSLR